MNTSGCRKSRRLKDILLSPPAFFVISRQMAAHASMAATCRATYSELCVLRSRIRGGTSPIRSLYCPYRNNLIFMFIFKSAWQYVEYDILLYQREGSILMYEIILYDTEDGRCPVQELLDSLEPKLLAKTLRTMDLWKNLRKRQKQKRNWQKI